MSIALFSSRRLIRTEKSEWGVKMQVAMRKGELRASAKWGMYVWSGEIADRGWLGGGGR